MAHVDARSLPFSRDVSRVMTEFLDGEVRPKNTLDAALARVGLAREEAAWPDLFAPAGTTLALPRESALSISTESAAMYKRWIGLADDEIESGARLGVSARPRTATPSADAEREDIENAALAYLWGPSKDVAAWRETIERTFAPFSAHVVTFGTIHLGEGASLVIDNTPAIVIAERLVLDGGSLTISTPSHLTIGEVIKRR